MAYKISRCNSCGEYFDAKKLLREHIDKNHRITNYKIRRAEAPHSNIVIADARESLF